MNWNEAIRKIEDERRVERARSLRASCSGFLSAAQIPIGSWWRAADGGQYGCVVLSVNLNTEDATVLGTDGNQRKIDTFKLQYRYAHCIPNAEVSDETPRE